MAPLLSVCLILARDPQDTALAKAAFAQFNSQVRTFACRFEVKFQEDAAQSYSGEYRRSAEGVRTLCKFPGFSTDTLVRGQERMLLQKDHLMIDDAASSGGAALDVWGLVFLKLYGPKNFLVPVEELFDDPAVQATAKESLDGSGDLEVELKDPHRTQRLRLSRAKNYFPIRYRADSNSPGFMNEGEATQFAELAPGIYFPKEVRCVQEFAPPPSFKKVRVSTITVFTDLALNKPLPPNAFEQTLPPGTRVADAIRGQIEVVDAGGRRQATGKKLHARDSLGMQAPKAPLLMQTQPEEASSWLVWLWAAAAVLASAFLAAFARRRFRSAA